LVAAPPPSPSHFSAFCDVKIAVAEDGPVIVNVRINGDVEPPVSWEIARPSGQFDFCADYHIDGPHQLRGLHCSKSAIR
jgi:hypothetical protein